MNYGNSPSTLNKEDRDMQVVPECRYWSKESTGFYGIEISRLVPELRSAHLCYFSSKLIKSPGKDQKKIGHTLFLGLATDFG